MESCRGKYIGKFDSMEEADEAAVKLIDIKKLKEQRKNLNDLIKRLSE